MVDVRSSSSLAGIGAGAAAGAFLLALVVFCLCRRFCCRSKPRRKSNYFTTMAPDHERAGQSALRRHLKQILRIGAPGAVHPDDQQRRAGFLHMSHQGSRGKSAHIPQWPPVSEVTVNGEDGGLPLPNDAEYPTEIDRHVCLRRANIPSDVPDGRARRTLSHSPALLPCLGIIAYQRNQTPTASPTTSPSSSPLTARANSRFSFEGASRSARLGGDVRSSLKLPGSFLGTVNGTAAQCSLPQVTRLSPAEKAQRLNAQINGMHSDESLGGHGELGQLSFSVSYRSRERVLLVGICSATNLPPGTKEPYVHIYAVNRKRKVFAVTPISIPKSGARTAIAPLDQVSRDSVISANFSLERAESDVKFDPRNPEFNKLLEFSNVADEQLLQSCLRLSVKDHRNTLRNRSKRIGEILLPLNVLELNGSCAELKLNVNLRAETKFWPSTATSRGELRIHLDFPKEHEQQLLRCNVMEAVHLPRASTGESYNVYIKLSYSVDNKIQQKHRSRLQSCSCDLLNHDSKCAINHSIAVNTEGVTADRIQITIVLKYKSAARLNRSGEIGKVILSANAMGHLERTHWNEAVAGEATTRMHQLHD